MKRSAKRASLVLSSFLLVSACQHSGNTNPPASTHKWNWVSGSNTVNQVGTYGSQGAADAANVPGARESTISWLDSSGRLWLFGGNGYDSVGYRGRLNDLWNYDPTTAKWTWVSGSHTIDQAGIYGIKGVADLSNIPGARSGAVSWIDAQGALWLFGGLGYSEAGGYGHLNDLWEFDPTTLEWTWISGGNSAGQAGIYGTQGAADPSNIPGARTGAVSWIDAQGQLWLFGGYGYDSVGTKGWLNDLWKYDPTTLEWTWMSGSVTGGQAGTYGTKGTADPANVPGGRYTAISWLDSNGSLWLFGGEGLDSDSSWGNLNDLWEYDPATLEWTWISGASSIGGLGTYGTQDTPASTNVPGSRTGAVSWIDTKGQLWLFGGYGDDSASANRWLNDLWTFNPTKLEWAWISGSSTGGAKGSYGTKGTADTSNYPGARYAAASWMDSSGRLWLFGGYGADSAGAGGWLNDLWHFTK